MTPEEPQRPFSSKRIIFGSRIAYSQLGQTAYLLTLRCHFQQTYRFCTDWANSSNGSSLSEFGLMNLALPSFGCFILLEYVYLLSSGFQVLFPILPIPSASLIQIIQLQFTYNQIDIIYIFAYKNVEIRLLLKQTIMQKYDKAGHSAHHKCQICQKDSNNDCTLTDVAHYCAQTGNLTMASRLACKSCRQQVTTIRQYVEENALSFSKNSSLYKQLIQPYLPKDNQIRVSEQSEIYQKSIQQQIKRNKLYHCASLPPNCLQLVYYSSFSVNHAERHQRIRNTISEVMRAAPIPYANLEDVANLVHCLSCYMHETNVVNLLKVICERVIIEGSPITPPYLNSQLPTQRIWKELYLKSYIGNILIIISEMLKDWKNFDLNFQKLRQFNGYIKKQKISSVLVTADNSPARKKVLMDIATKQGDILNGNCKQCVKNRIESMLNQARMKNLFSLSLSYLIKQDAAQRQHISQLEVKFTKQKQQFINKIIKLKDKIEILEHEESEDPSKLRRARSVSQYHIHKNYKPDLEEVSEKSQGTSRTIQIKEKNDQNGKTNQTQKAKQNENGSLDYFHKLVVHIPEFDPSFLASDADEKLLFSTIQNSIKNMKDSLDKLQKKCRLLENQSKRLLTILTRKQERFVPLIHQKDEIIQRYQNALWRMQHSLPVQDPALAPRIFAIINVFKSQFLQSLSTGTLQSDIGIQEHADLSPPSSKTSKKKKSNQKIREKTEKKIKNSEKQCLIF